LTTDENDAVRLPPGRADIIGQPSEAGEFQRSPVAAAVIEPSTLPLPRSALEIIPPQVPRATSHRRRGGTRGPWWRLAADPWPLLGILTVQAALSVRLFWTNTAFQDEALYLWSGHLEWAHWLHGARLPTSFPTFLSGAPVIYPPLGAIAVATTLLQARTRGCGRQRLCDPPRRTRGPDPGAARARSPDTGAGGRARGAGAVSDPRSDRRRRERLSDGAAGRR